MDGSTVQLSCPHFSRASLLRRWPSRPRHGLLADDWTAVRLRGEVFVYRDGWVKLERGDVVSDDSIIRTLGRGRVSFQRDAETIELLPNSQIRIVDQTGRKFTTVMSDYGKVSIDAEALNVEHFSVATPYLAAVVKGTRLAFERR